MTERDVQTYTQNLVNEYHDLLAEQAEEKNINLFQYLEEKSPLMFEFLSRIQMENGIVTQGK